MEWSGGCCTNTERFIYLCSVGISVERGKYSHESFDVQKDFYFSYSTIPLMVRDKLIFLLVAKGVFGES